VELSDLAGYAPLQSYPQGRNSGSMTNGRLESDYADWVDLDKQDVEQELLGAQEFVNAVIALINKQ